jgi:hypothetical protein
VLELMEAAHFVLARLAPHLAQAAPRACDLIKAHVGRKAEDVIAARLLALCHHRLAAVMPVAAHEDLSTRPAAADAPDHMMQHARRLLAGRALTSRTSRTSRKSLILQPAPE